MAQVIDDRTVDQIRNPGVAVTPHDHQFHLQLIDHTGQLRDRIGELDPSRPVVTYCAGGYRSSIAASLLRASGFTDVSDLIGGYQGWLAA